MRKTLSKNEKICYNEVSSCTNYFSMKNTKLEVVVGNYGLTRLGGFYDSEADLNGLCALAKLHVATIGRALPGSGLFSSVAGH